MGKCAPWILVDEFDETLKAERPKEKDARLPDDGCRVFERTGEKELRSILRERFITNLLLEGRRPRSAKRAARCGNSRFIFGEYKEDDDSGVQILGEIG